MERRVALVTGGNSGIGLTICERLLTLHNDLELCLLCRNVTRAEAAKNALLISHPNSTISIIVMDTSDVKSVFKAAKILKERYKRIDFLFLNAGIMPVTGVNWSNVVKGILSTKCAHVMSSGEGCLYHTDQVTKDGLKNIFASNVFGHYALIKEMEERLGGEKDTQIIWTSSRAAMLSAFDINDIQHRHGDDPYASSKYVIDTVSVSLNDNLNKKTSLPYNRIGATKCVFPYNMSWISDDKSDQWDPSKLGLEYAVSNFNDTKNILLQYNFFSL